MSATSFDPRKILQTMKLFTTSGNVALNNIVWRSVGKYANSCSMIRVNSGLRSLSASSIMKIGHSLKSATPFPARSRILPGVPTSICTASFSRMISSFRPVPPVVTMTLMPRYLPKVLQTWDVCKANSLVGTRINTWVFVLLGLTRSSAGMTNAAVFPVPFFALARMSRPVSATGIVSSCIGDGLSKPASNMPLNSSCLIYKSSNSRPLVAVTS